MDGKIFTCMLLVFLVSFIFVNGATTYPSGWSCEGATCECTAERCLYPELEDELAPQGEIIDLSVLDVDISTIKALPPAKEEWWLVEGPRGSTGIGLVLVIKAYDKDHAEEEFKELVKNPAITISSVTVAQIGVPTSDADGKFIVNAQGEKIYAPQETRSGDKWYISPEASEWAWNPIEEKWVPSSQVPQIAELDEGSADLSKPTSQKPSTSAAPASPSVSTTSAPSFRPALVQGTAASPTAISSGTENCLNPQHCQEIDAVWLIIVKWVNSARINQIYNTITGKFELKVRPEITLAPEIVAPRPEIKQAIKSAAEAEYARWDNGARRESEPQMKPIVASYFVAGGPNCAGSDPIAVPWSAAFISYVMKKAGVSDFPGRCAHTQYFKAVHDNPGTCRTYPMSEREKIAAGDVVCRCRPSETDKCSGDYNNAYGHSHCDIVVNVVGGKVEVIGGNVNDNVEKRTLDVNVDEPGKEWYGFISCEGLPAAKPVAVPTNFCVATQGTNEQKALLDMIAWAEGTNERYNMLANGELYQDNNNQYAKEGSRNIFRSFDNHPNVLIRWRSGDCNGGDQSACTSAAGRYGFLFKTYNGLKPQGYFQTGFVSQEQDKAGLALIEQRGVTDSDLKTATSTGAFVSIFDKLAPEWASLPYSPKGGKSYHSNQPARAVSDLMNVYHSCLQYHQTGGLSGTVSSVASGVTDAVSGASGFILGIFSGNCPQEMANVNDKYCIDKWENSIYNKNNPSERASLYYPAKTSQANTLYNYWKNGWKGTPPPNSAYAQMPERGAEITTGFAGLAMSQPNVIPNMYVSKEIAEQACANAGKRLCTVDEWLQACKGPSSTRYPYGNDYVAGRCNTNQAGKYPPGVVGWQQTIPKDQFDPTDPRNGKAAVDIHGVRETGFFSACTNDYGVYDMVGNLAEVVSTSSSSGNAIFKGSAFMRAGSNLNCDDSITGHNSVYTDYSFGFRCCATLSS